jgi:leucyl/phenylalanyl-tRNA---protein transferase
MTVEVFPDPKTFDYPKWVLMDHYFYRGNDIVSFGTPLTVDTVSEAYPKGIFPWYTEGVPLPWHCPEHRAIVVFDELTVPRSLAKSRRVSGLRFTIDSDFKAVIEACSLAKRSRSSGKTWITADFIRVYSQLHDIGMAHSVEAWDESGHLVGGLYGVDAGGVFCGESMFYKAPNASKLALLFLIDHLRARGATWLDAQVMTPHMEALGARELDRGEFLEKLEATKKKGLQLFDKTI